MEKKGDKLMGYWYQKQRRKERDEEFARKVRKSFTGFSPIRVPPTTTQPAPQPAPQPTVPSPDMTSITNQILQNLGLSPLPSPTTMPNPFLSPSPITNQIPQNLGLSTPTDKTLTGVSPIKPYYNLISSPPPVPYAYQPQQLNPFVYNTLMGLGPPEQSPIFSTLSGIQNLYQMLGGF